ncbi:aspartate carbamoyltransferase catalytic subunit [Lacticaseibacillus kribbianus]|uniref:aspartate carbamoyltransferase catalytic subunit n=1 Tax=Lacticaseibacillus kribbianus TaxID=2926292 RepID=UPI001CD799B1|nr:aspartate carbamoyltransferase catalytic subunit [Lacticaseibacillus kribbianus]
MTLHDFVSATQVSPAFANQLIDRAQAFQKGAAPLLTTPYYAANLFFENSTRTHTSFEMAERKLGMTVLPFNPAQSSVTKGETLEDTLRTLAAIGVQVAVVRHPKDAYYAPLLEADLPLHLVNAGDGAGQHPSQMMLDLMTIRAEFGHFAGLRVGIVGDLTHSRVAHSDMTLLTQLGASVMFGGPAEWYTPEFAAVGPRLAMADLVPKCDVLMLLRVQLERLSGEETAGFDAAAYHQAYGLTEELYERLAPHAIIMHPAPVNRGVELASSLVTAPKSRIFTQMHNGVYMRMAMLEAVCAND